VPFFRACLFRTIWRSKAYRLNVSSGNAAPAPASETGTDSELTPAPTPVACWQTSHYPPRLHASQLLSWLLHEGYASREILAADLQRLYTQFCEELNWAVRPWNPVARELTRLTTGRKNYCWIIEDGLRRRLRVYPVPTPSDSETGVVHGQAAIVGPFTMTAVRCGPTSSRLAVNSRLVPRPSAVRRRRHASGT